MIDGLEPYLEYRDSDLPWVGRKVPSHWSQRRTKFLFRERAQKGFPDEPLLAATQTKGVVRKEDYGERTVTAQKDFHLLKLVETGDFVISLRSFEGGIEVAHCRGIISPAYTILQPRADADRKYFCHFFKSPDFIRSLTLFVTGIREGQNIDYGRMSRAYMPLPPQEDQLAIGQFLDHANARIERAIRAKKKLIALLNEQKQAIIHRAVTRGLNGAVPLKPSGAPWLGDVPRHWETAALRRICTSWCDGPFGSGLKSSHYVESGIRVVRLQNIRSAEFRDGVPAFISRAHYATLGDHDVISGDLLVAGLGDNKIPAGRACIAPNGIEPAMVKADCFRYRLRTRGVCPQFLALQLSATAAAATACLSTGATRQRISLFAAGARSIALPPLAEQNAILEFVLAEATPVDSAIHRTEREITLLREFRTRLVADVVTGQLDVRGAAAKLPQKTEKPTESEIEPADLDETEAPGVEHAGT